MPPVIGIPGTLAYYTYYPFWRALLTSLGCEVIVSEPSNRAILDDGVRETVNDACVPIKLFHGHALSLINKVDFIFCPRLISADGRSTFCPKFLGLPDMLRFCRSDLPPLIDVPFQIRNWHASVMKFCTGIVRKLKLNRFHIPLAYAKAYAALLHYQAMIRRRIDPRTLLDQQTSSVHLQTPSAILNVAVVGFPYLLYDRYVSLDMLGRLSSLGVSTSTPDMLSQRAISSHARKLPLPYFWYYSNRVAGSALYYMEQPHINGIIHVTAFGCGPDSMLNRALEMYSRQQGKPFMTITVDEHTGEGGIVTRLEAFVDMLPHHRQTAVASS